MFVIWQHNLGVLIILIYIIYRYMNVIGDGGLPQDEGCVLMRLREKPWYIIEQGKRPRAMWTCSHAERHLSQLSKYTFALLFHVCVIKSPGCETCLFTVCAGSAARPPASQPASTLALLPASSSASLGGLRRGGGSPRRELHNAKHNNAESVGATLIQLPKQCGSGVRGAGSGGLVPTWRRFFFVPLWNKPMKLWGNNSNQNNELKDDKTLSG